MEESTPKWATFLAVSLVVLGVLGSLAVSAAFVWALVEVVTWLVSK
jgi:hypothetical protein